MVGQQMKLNKHPEYPHKTKYDGYAKFLYHRFRPTTKTMWPLWKNLKLKDKDYWRGMAQIYKEQDL